MRLLFVTGWKRAVFLSFHPDALLLCVYSFCQLQAVREDLGLQRLVLETCRGHLRALRTSTAAAITGLSVEIGGGWSVKGVVSSLPGAFGIQDGPQDEADAARAGKAAVSKCTVLAPLLLKETFRQVRNADTRNDSAPVFWMREYSE